MKKVRILWVDDEIDLLKPHIMFLEGKDYQVNTATNGQDAIEMVQKETFDLLFLDENMPGMSGIETLNKIRSFNNFIPIIMITKSEEEDIMDVAIGSKINDYLIKPVNPKQILLSIKKHIDTQRLVTQETSSAFLSGLGQITMEAMQANSFNEWKDLYKKLVYWELELAQSDDPNLKEVLESRKKETNDGFTRFVSKNYLQWLNNPSDDKPLFLTNIVKDRVLPALDGERKVVFIVIDNLRYDQWKIIQPAVQQNFYIDSEELCSSILPTATQFARNALFSGLMPLEIQKMYPKYWIDEDEDESKNNYELELLQLQLKRLGKNLKINYHKVLNHRTGKKVLEEFKNFENYDLNVLVYNFVDMLSHARTDSEMVKELASDEAAFRALTSTWFSNSYLKNLLNELSQANYKVFITTDHGTVQVTNPVKVIGDKNTSVNIRYKQGRNLNYEANEVFVIKDPKLAHLPQANLSSSYIFARNYDFMVYPKNYNQFVNYYRNTFQHGGISMEEMLIPFIALSPKK